MLSGLMVVKQFLMSQSNPVMSRDHVYVWNLSSGLCRKKRSWSERGFIRSLTYWTRKHVGLHLFFILAYSSMWTRRCHRGLFLSLWERFRHRATGAFTKNKQMEGKKKPKHCLNVKELSSSWLNKWIQKEVRLKFLQTAEGNREVEHGELHFSHTMGFCR